MASFFESFLPFLSLCVARRFDAEGGDNLYGTRTHMCTYAHMRTPTRVQTYTERTNSVRYVCTLRQLPFVSVQRNFVTEDAFVRHFGSFSWFLSLSQIWEWAVKIHPKIPQLALSKSVNWEA